MREDQQEHQQQMMEIMEKVSDQVKVENIHSGSVLALEGEYYTPSKLRTPPNLPTFSGQEPVPSTEGSIDQWLFQVEGALATHTEEAVRSAVIGSVRGAARELPRVYRLWRGNECHTLTHKKKNLDKAFLRQSSRRNSS